VGRLLVGDGEEQKRSGRCGKAGGGEEARREGGPVAARRRSGRLILFIIQKFLTEIVLPQFFYFGM